MARDWLDTSVLKVSNTGKPTLKSAIAPVAMATAAQSGTSIVSSSRDAAPPATAKAEESGEEAEEGPAASLRIIEEAISRAEDKNAGVESKEVKKKIESRLEFLARMYASDKEKEAEKESEEEKNKES